MLDGRLRAARFAQQPAIAADIRRDGRHLNVRANMVAKCANPSCSTEFKYFREGRLYEFMAGKDGCWKSPAEAPGKSDKRELFWLCQHCAQFFTMTCEDGQLRVIHRARSAA